MLTDLQLDEYMAEVRERVCSKCSEHPPGGPPCAPLGKRCAIELNFPLIVNAVHAEPGISMEPYMRHFHETVCTQCANRRTHQCPCPMEFLLLLAVEAIEAVDERQTVGMA